MNYELKNENFRSNYLENLLRARGINYVSAFLAPPPASLQNPYFLSNIEVGAAEYMEVVNKSGKILLLPDCDVDGMTSAAIFYLYTKGRNPNVEIDYLIHKHKQHGLEDHIDTILNTDKKYDLIVLPDAGSNDKIYFDQLQEIGIKSLVIDHHQLDNEISTNCTIINNQISPEYCNKELTGAGVTWQFCRYIDERYYDDNLADSFVDLAALGIIGDMGSVLQQENRYIIHKGIKNISNFFFKVLMDKQSFVMGETTPTSIAFYITPLINGLIRAGTEEEKTLLFEAFIHGADLIDSDKRGAKPGDKESIAAQCARKCSNSKNRQNSAIEQMEAELEARIYKYGLLDNKILVVTLEPEDDMPQEFNGLVAMRLSRKFNRPTLMVREDENGALCGSGRGINSNLFDDFKGFLEESKLFNFVQGKM